MPLLDGIFQ